MALVHLSSDRPFVTDGGLETVLVFQRGMDLADFAAFPLLDGPEGRSALTEYYASFIQLADRMGTGIVLDTPTWRANPDWGARAGYDHEGVAAMNQRAVDFVRQVAAAYPAVTSVVNGVHGPRGDGYVVGNAMSVDEAAEYHGLQARAFADAGADMVSAITMTYSAEAIGVALAAQAVSMPSVISFTVETDGLLPSGESLAEAVDRVDEATDGSPEYYMINCAHPTHFRSVLDADGAWTRRIRGIRANASRLSHAELDEATELDRGDIAELARLYADIHAAFDLRVVGGCCGTDVDHVTAIAHAVIGEPA